MEKGVALGGVRAVVGVPRRCGDCERPCGTEEDGVPNGEEVCDTGAAGEAEERGREDGGGVALANDCLIGDTLGDGGGVGVTECSCLSTIESRICMRAERMVETFCCISIISCSLLCVVIRSERGQASSSEAVWRKSRPRESVSGVRTSCSINNDITIISST